MLLFLNDSHKKAATHVFRERRVPSDHRKGADGGFSRWRLFSYACGSAGCGSFFSSTW